MLGIACELLLKAVAKGIGNTLLSSALRAATTKKKYLGDQPIVLSLGEVLWDLLPEGRTFGGAPANVAWHAAQLGAESFLASAVGNDDLGHELLARLDAMALSPRLVAVLPDRPTGVVEVSLNSAGDASYRIREDAAWDFISAGPELLELAARADAVNFGSLAQRSPASRRAVREVLAAVRPEALKVFDVNLRPPFVDSRVLSESLDLASVVKMNAEELAELANRFGWSREPEKAMSDLLAAHSGVAHLVVTRADKGAWWRTRSGKGVWWLPRDRLISRAPEREVRVRDSVGAGDSATACVILGLLHEKSEEDILEHALRVASFVCEQPGGTPELPARLQERPWRWLRREAGAD